MPSVTNKKRYNNDDVRNATSTATSAVTFTDLVLHGATLNFDRLDHWRYDFQHNVIQLNDTQHNLKDADILFINGAECCNFAIKQSNVILGVMLSVILLSVIVSRIVMLSATTPRIGLNLPSPALHCHDIQHNANQHNDTQHNLKNGVFLFKITSSCNLAIMLSNVILSLLVSVTTHGFVMLSVIMPSFILLSVII